ncbi:hypothetical protein HW555_009504 [Spodoptera exigua]|uniref:ER membrane protein complex subunit 10 n=1 Tax=Spodoptera exigua TaxID=7107 RepID=A0A835GCA1_SPOEX|nr:hypothetical protein HW555_009504 [Spodoptera exigua]
MHLQSFAVILSLGLVNYAACIDYDGWLNIKIEHSLNCGTEKYCPRGNIALKSIRAGAAVVDQIHFNKGHIEALKNLAEIDSFYTIRTLVTSAENSKGTEFFSSVKARAFLGNGLSEFFSVSFQVTNASQPLSLESGTQKINSNFYLRYVAMPDTATYIQKLEREREAREKGDLKDNKSFLAKYWMYIVPIAIFVMISGASNPEPAAQGAR